MASIRSRLRKLFATAPPPSAGELMLGLPLEAGDRRIYPVYSRYGRTNGAHQSEDPAQIGYVEIDDRQARFVPLDDRRVWMLALVPVGIVVGLAAFFYRLVGRRSASGWRGKQE